MHKKISKRAAGWVCGFLSQIFAMIMAGILIVVSSKFIMYHDYYGAFFSSPIDESSSFMESDTFQNIFYRDMAGLATYLACCAQLETDGEYDEDKVIDVFAYQDRKEAATENKQDYPMLTYRLGDLLSWHESGINYYNEPVEVPVEGYQESVFKIEELYRPLNVDSIFDLELPEDMSYHDVVLTIDAAAANLMYNYHDYLSYHQQFGTDNNVKYMFVAQDGTIAYTNLENQNNLSVDGLKTAFMGSEVYLVYDYAREGHGRKKFESAGIHEVMKMAYKTAFSDRAYSFPEGGTLYVALQTETNEAFGVLNENDFYAYNMNSDFTEAAFWKQMAPLALIAGILALVTFILFSLFQPKKKKEELRYFDKWFTEFAACFALLSAYFVGVMGMLITKTVMIDIAELTLARRRDAFIIGAFITFAILYLMLLVYMGSLVRRIKAGAFWKGSFCYYVLHNMKTICRKTRDFAAKVFGVILNHKILLIRTFVPYGLFLFLNVAFPFVLGGPGLILNMVMDLLVAAYLYLNNKAREDIVNGISRICEGEVDYQIQTDKLYGENKVIAEAVNQIGNAVKNAVQISMKDERLKADLITNVSHDIKTPLTSIINYVDLLKRENIQGEKAQEYIRILDEKSQRLKQLTLDLVEASKISSGNITLEMEDLDVTELMKQALGEYEDRLEEKKLSVMFHYPQNGEKAIIYADSRRMWRILENLFGNICKYAMESTRVYVDIEKLESDVEIIIRNISAQPLNIPADELTQRFIRGDISRSTEGSGLGLSIARNLTTAQNGKFKIYLDGDLFKVSIRFPLHQTKVNGTVH